MPAYTREGCSQGSIAGLTAACEEDGPSVDYYFQDATRKLASITDLANRGEVVDRDSRDWMLSQVDFIVDTIGNESLELGDELRSNLLQLLLAIANLNEQIRHHASLNL